MSFLELVKSLYTLDDALSGGKLSKQQAHFNSSNQFLALYGHKAAVVFPQANPLDQAVQPSVGLLDLITLVVVLDESDARTNKAVHEPVCKNIKFFEVKSVAELLSPADVHEHLDKRKPLDHLYSLHRAQAFLDVEVLPARISNFVVTVYQKSQIVKVKDTPLGGVFEMRYYSVVLLGLFIAVFQAELRAGFFDSLCGRSVVRFAQLAQSNKIVVFFLLLIARAQDLLSHLVELLISGRVKQRCSQQCLAAVAQLLLPDHLLQEITDQLPLLKSRSHEQNLYVGSLVLPVDQEGPAETVQRLIESLFVNQKIPLGCVEELGLLRKIQGSLTIQQRSFAAVQDDSSLQLDIFFIVLLLFGIELDQPLIIGQGLVEKATLCMLMSDAQDNCGVEQVVMVPFAQDRHTFTLPLLLHKVVKSLVAILKMRVKFDGLPQPKAGSVVLLNVLPSPGHFEVQLCDIGYPAESFKEDCDLLFAVVQLQTALQRCSPYFPHFLYAAHFYQPAAAIKSLLVVAGLILVYCLFESCSSLKAQSYFLPDTQQTVRDILQFLRHSFAI